MSGSTDGPMVQTVTAMNAAELYTLEPDAFDKVYEWASQHGVPNQLAKMAAAWGRETHSPVVRQRISEWLASVATAPPGSIPHRYYRALRTAASLHIPPLLREIGLNAEAVEMEAVLPAPPKRPLGLRRLRTLLRRVIGASYEYINSPEATRPVAGVSDQVLQDTWFAVAAETGVRRMLQIGLFSPVDRRWRRMGADTEWIYHVALHYVLRKRLVDEERAGRAPNRQLARLKRKLNAELLPHSYTMLNSMLE